MNQRIDNLRDAIQIGHHCRAEHVASTLIVERLPNGAIWRGPVEVFDIIGHPEAKRCYAWSQSAATQESPVIVLEIAPVRSAQTAVRTAFVRQ